MFNQNSPSILYGLLGFKVYFYYMPLFFVGYALIRNDVDLRKFLVVSAVLAGVISILGIIQAIIGNSFLNPAKLAPELEELGNLTKSTPLSNRLLSLPDSVFVSAGRFDEYLVWVFVLTLGTAALFPASQLAPTGKWCLPQAGLVVTATLLSGSRSSVIAVVVSALALPAAFLWGAPWRWGQAHRLVKAIRRTAIATALALAALILLFPEDAGSRITYYAETLDPRSAAYEGGNRSWDYPVDNFLYAFEQPNWGLGNGIGTASLGAQYVAKVLGTRQPNLGVEEGYGNLIVAEMGVAAPFLWLLWTGSVLYYSWKVAKRLRETLWLFPIAIAIVWYAFIPVIRIHIRGVRSLSKLCSPTPLSLRLLLGILRVRLPDLLVAPLVPVVAPSSKSSIDAFQF